MTFALTCIFRIRMPERFLFNSMLFSMLSIVIRWSQWPRGFATGFAGSVDSNPAGVMEFFLL
jgi:hypothetical protein